MRVLFICRANAARSQMGEALYNALSGTTDATSAGLDLGHSIMKDDPRLPPKPIEVLKEIGIDVSSKSRKPLTEAMITEADMVIAMIREGEFPLPPYLSSSPKLIRWEDIPDPKGNDLEFFRKTRDDIKTRVETLVRKG